MNIEYEDSFVKIAGILGGEDYFRVARALLNNENSTDEEIASATGLKVNLVRKALYDLFGRSLIIGIRVRDLKRGWFVYRWKAQRDNMDGFVDSHKKKSLERLKQRLSYEETHEFYSCNSPTCQNLTFEQAMEAFFKCRSCGETMNLIQNNELIESLKWKIQQLETELPNESKV